MTTDTPRRAQHHVIRRQIVEVNLPGSEADGFALQRRVAGLCRDWLGPALEATLDSVAPSDEHWSIDSLVIDAGCFRAETFERDFIGAVTDALRREIEDRAGGRGGALQRGGGTTPGHRGVGAAGATGGVERRTDAQSINRAFLHFLSTGTLPWWLRLRDGQSLEQAMTACWHDTVATPGAARSLLAAITTYAMRIRLVRQFSPAFLDALLRAMAPDAVALVGRLLAEMERLALPAGTARQFSEQLWQNVVLAASSGRGAAAAEDVAERVHAMLTMPGGLQLPAPAVRSLRAVARLRTRSSNSSTAATGSVPAPAEQPGASIDLEEGLFVECAGLVILHPFLPLLFRALGISAGPTMVQPERALCLMHFLATGQRVAPEYALVLPKLLCNLPLEEPLAAPHMLTTAEEEEALVMLAAVIGHWGALGKNTTADILRGTFLVRPGKLSRRNNDHLLQVETQDHEGFDLLLTQLPWGLSQIQLPWMTNKLWVEWN